MLGHKKPKAGPDPSQSAFASYVGISMSSAATVEHRCGAPNLYASSILDRTGFVNAWLADAGSQ